MLDQLSKNITRCGLSNSTLNYLRVSLIMQSLLHLIFFVSAPCLPPDKPLTSLVSPQLCVILEPMQELMSRHKTYSLSPRDCLKTCLFQKWQRMVAPPGECLVPAPTLNQDLITLPTAVSQSHEAPSWLLIFQG